MIKYLGSKRKLLNDIYQAVNGNDVKTVVDVFSGTARVGHFLKKNGLRVFSNDMTTYARVIAECYVKADKETYSEDAKKIIEEYNASSGKLAGYITDTFCVKSRFFHPDNGERIDFIREDLEAKSLDPILKSVVLTSLMEAADRVDSTVGLQMAYLKQYAKRALNPLQMRLPELLPASGHGKCEVFQEDALALAPKITGEYAADVAYLDPPYNAHSYLGNYHVWESLCVWDKPEVYGIACKRMDVRDRKSAYNSKKSAIETFDKLVQALEVKKVVVSFNNEGFISKEEMENLLSKKGTVQTIEKDYKRYVGAQIGIHNLEGEKVGQVSHLKNKEYIYVVNC